MRFRIQNMVLAVIALAGAGCATVTPCIQMPADGKPVVVDFGDDITMRIDRVLVRDDPGRPFVVHGVVRNRSLRHWRDVTLLAKLEFQAPDADADTDASPDVTGSGGGQAAATGAMPMNLRASVKFLGPGDTAMELEAGCVGQPRDCMFKGLRLGQGWQMEMKYDAQAALKDGTCRTLTGVSLPRRARGHYPLRPRLVLLGPEAAETGRLTVVPAEAGLEAPAKDASPKIEPSKNSPPKDEQPELEPSKAAPANEAWALMYDGHFEDEHVDVNLYFSVDEFHLSIQNRSAQTIRIDWDGLVWVDPEGYAMPLVRSSLQPGAARAAATPAVIPSHARVKVALMRDDGRLPTPDRPRHSQPRYPFVAHGPSGEAQVGQILGIYLPVTVGETPHPLDLRFRIEALLPTKGGMRQPRRKHTPGSSKREQEKAGSQPAPKAESNEGTDAPSPSHE